MAIPNDSGLPAEAECDFMKEMENKVRSLDVGCDELRILDGSSICAGMLCFEGQRRGLR